jgi:hypothetical protein
MKAVLIEGFLTDTSQLCYEVVKNDDFLFPRLMFTLNKAKAEQFLKEYSDEQMA